jgi:hypothetical protein
LWHRRWSNNATWGGGRGWRLRLSAAPIDLRLREGADAGKPLVVADPDAPASQALLGIAAAMPPRRAGGQVAEAAALSGLSGAPIDPGSAVRPMA